MPNFTENAYSPSENNCLDGNTYEMASNNVGMKTNSRMSVGLLDMLAEVASNSLEHDRSLPAPLEKHQTLCKNSRNRANRLLRMFSKFDGDEMRRKFTFSCLFDVGGCEMSFSSFGSELKARQNMKSHLVEHVQQAGDTFDCGFYKRRKMQPTNRKSVAKKGCTGTAEHLCPNSTPLKSSYTRIPSHNKNNKLQNSSMVVKPSKTLQCDFKHFCGKAKCDKLARTMTQSQIFVVYDEHNYTAQKKNTDTISSTTDVELANIKPAEVSVALEKNASNGLNNFMMHEVDSNNIFVECVGSNNSQLINLPHVGQEVAVNTTEVPRLSSVGMGALESPGDVFVQSNATSDYGRTFVSTAKKEDGRAGPDNEQGKVAEKRLSDKEMAIKLIAEAKFKGAPKFLDCTICSPRRQFTALTTLISHYRSHAGIKPFECTICHRAFTRQHSLNYHLLIHQNLTRFTCVHCSRKFRHPSHFREHLRKHTGEEPFQCTDCLARFKTRNTFKRHLKSHHSKLLTASGELVQLKDGSEQVALPPHEVSKELSLPAYTQEPQMPQVQALTHQRAGRENVLEWDVQVEDIAKKRELSCDRNDKRAIWRSSGLLVVSVQGIVPDNISSGSTLNDFSSDSNNNSTDQSAFLAATNKISKSSVGMYRNK